MLDQPRDRIGVHVTGDRHPLEGGNPEFVLEFLSAHRQSTQRRGTRKGRPGRGRRKTALLLGVVAVLAAVGATVLIRGSFAHSKPASHQQATATISGKKAGPVSRAATPAAAPRKVQQAAAAPAANEPWHRGFYPWRGAGRSKLPTIYYRFVQAHVTTCTGEGSYGCWKAKVISRRPCPHGVTVWMTEIQHGTQVGQQMGTSRPLAPRTMGIVEVDTYREHVDGRLGSMTCN